MNVLVLDAEVDLNLIVLVPTRERKLYIHVMVALDSEKKIIVSVFGARDNIGPIECHRVVVGRTHDAFEPNIKVILIDRFHHATI